MLKCSIRLRLSSQTCLPGETGLNIADGEAGGGRSVAAQPPRLDPKRASMRLIEEPDDMEIDWARLIEERKTSKPGEVKQEPTTENVTKPGPAAEAPAEDETCTALATDSQAVAATTAAGVLQDAQQRDGSVPPEQPEVPSLLQAFPALLTMCRHVLPDAPLQHLYSAFPNTRPRKRADWEAFQKALKESSAAAEPEKPPGTPCLLYTSPSPRD